MTTNVVLCVKRETKGKESEQVEFVYVDAKDKPLDIWFNRQVLPLSIQLICDQIEEWDLGVEGSEVTISLIRALKEDRKTSMAVIYLNQFDNAYAISGAALFTSFTKAGCEAALLLSFIVAPLFQKLGLGRVRMDNLEKFLRMCMSVKKIVLNPTFEAKGFWEHIGYRPVVDKSFGACFPGLTVSAPVGDVGRYPLEKVIA